MCSEYQAVLLVVPQKDNLVMDCTTSSATLSILRPAQPHSSQCPVSNRLLYERAKYQSWQKCEGNMATKQGGF